MATDHRTEAQVVHPGDPKPHGVSGAMVLVYIFMKSYYILTKYLDPNMVPTYTMGCRFNMVDHMCLCSHG